ncbi:MAG: protein phosphatase CheZ [Alphaproteobacteria bacterium]|jgi:chemotaxis protein CheZ|nr:protein phosphatase CheZ [Candidatus Jidaibacter sp.]
MTTDSSQNLEQELEVIRYSKGSGLRFADIEMLIQAMINSTSINDPHNIIISQELLSVQNEIQYLKNNLASSSDSSDTYDLIISAITDLRDVFKIQESSTNEILDLSEKIMSIASSQQPDKQAIVDAAINICEKCNFQDLSGQRIQRVLNNLSKLEYVICTVLKAFMGIQVKRNSAKEQPVNANDSSTLMKGPQTLDKAPSQEDIDKLFA